MKRVFVVLKGNRRSFPTGCAIILSAVALASEAAGHLGEKPLIGEGNWEEGEVGQRIFSATITGILRDWSHSAPGEADIFHLRI
jgi:hypothetical protein